MFFEQKNLRQWKCDNSIFLLNNLGVMTVQNLNVYSLYEWLPNWNAFKIEEEEIKTSLIKINHWSYSFFSSAHLIFCAINSGIFKSVFNLFLFHIHLYKCTQAVNRSQTLSWTSYQAPSDWWVLVRKHRV